MDQNSYKTINEYKILKFLEGKITPKVFYLSNSKDNFFNTNILIMEYIDGIFKKPMFFDKKDIDKFIDSLTFIHNFKISKSLDLGQKLGIDFYLRDLEHFFRNNDIDNVNDIRLLFNKHKDIFLDCINHKTNYSIVHGDLRNHFIEKDNIFYIIDWESAYIGDSARDISHFLYFSKLDSRLKRYFIEKYLEKSNQDQIFLERVKNYMIIEEFIGLKWSKEQMVIRKTNNEKFFYKNLYNLRFKNLLEASKNFNNKEYYLNTGHLYFIN